MKNNKLLIAAAGSGKTTYLIEKACEIKKDESVLITTYTEANEAEIRHSIIKRKGFIPSNITVQTWFSFLLQHGLRPYQSILDDSIHNENISFFLISERSGFRYEMYGKPVYWGEQDFLKYYFTNDLKIYSDKLSKFVFTCNQAANNQIIDRISKIFKYIYIDEVQDLAGYDLEIIKLFFKSPSSILLVGDPRQVTYLTNHSAKFEKYSDGLIKDFIQNELGKKILCEIDENTLNASHRNNQSICNYSAKLYPSLPVPVACTCKVCREYTTEHEGVFLIRPRDITKYLTTYQPIQLRWSSSIKCDHNFQTLNFGESKGLSFDRVLIYPTKDMADWVRGKGAKLKNEPRAKFYVGITRARRSATIVLEYSNEEVFQGIEKFQFE